MRGSLYRCLCKWTQRCLLPINNLITIKPRPHPLDHKQYEAPPLCEDTPGHTPYRPISVLPGNQEMFPCVNGMA